MRPPPREEGRIINISNASTPQSKSGEQKNEARLENCSQKYDNGEYTRECSFSHSIIHAQHSQWRSQNVKTARSFPGQYGRKAGHLNRISR